MKRHYVETWDTNKQAFTPQAGVKSGPYSLFGLRRAVKRLRELGYEGRRNDPSVYVYSAERPKAERPVGERKRKVAQRAEN